MITTLVRDFIPMPSVRFALPLVHVRDFAMSKGVSGGVNRLIENSISSQSLCDELQDRGRHLLR
jgi:hypothetical protein